jgi:hypothetical protein
MSDDIVESLKRAGGDDGRPMGFGAAEVVRLGRIRRRRRRMFGGSATALGIAIVAVAAMTVMPWSGDDSDQPAGQPETVPLDRGPLSEQEVHEALIPLCVKDPDGLTIIYARKVESPSGTWPAVLATGRQLDGTIYSCGVSWSVRGDGPLNRMPDRAHPIVSIATDPVTVTQENGWRAWSGYYRVADSVTRIETRVGTPDGSEPWRASTPFHGVVFWSAWVEATYDDDEAVWLQWRAFDTDGHRIDPALLPDQPQLVDPTGSNDVAAEYDQISDLLHQVALDHLQSERGSLEGASARYGRQDDAGWSSVTTSLGWSPWRSVTTVVVELSLSRPGTYTDDELRAHIGCQTRVDCRRVDLGDQGWVWVGENDEGTIGVSHVQPDGEIAYIVIGAEHPYIDYVANESDLTVDQAIDFVTDDRLSLPTS